jgi:hypothetical protein
VEKIAQANQLYKLANGTFTREISDLDIDFAAEDCNYGVLSAKCSKYFIFAASNESGEQGYISLMQRKPIGEKYYLRIGLTGQRYCASYEHASDYEKELCRQYNAQ